MSNRSTDFELGKKQIAALKQIAQRSVFTLEFQVLSTEEGEEESKESNQEEVLKTQCALICNVMQLVSTIRNSPSFGDVEASRLEREVVYRSDFLHRLYAYLQHQYGAYTENFPNVFDQVRKDEEIIGLFCQILKKRMFIIDDMEFKSLKQSLSNKFLSIDQVLFASHTLNQIAYNVF